MFKKIICLFLIWRICLFSLAYFSPEVIPNFASRFPYVEMLKESKLPHWVWAFGNFDGVHYLRIAKDGYAYQYTQAFFPLFPVIVKTLSFFTLGNYLASALIVSNASFFVSLVIFYKLILHKYNEKIAFWSILFLLTFPTSFYFGAVYTESLFFLLIVSSFYLFEKNHLKYSYLLGLLASATRLAGIFLGPFLVKKRNKSSLIPLLVVPLGFIAYVFYLKVEFNNPLYFLTSQEIFGQARSTSHVVLLPQVFYRYTKILFSTQGLAFANAAFELLATIFALTIILFAYKKISFRWVGFSLLSIMLPTLTGTFASMPRYILLAFPIYIYLAMIKNTYIKICILIVFTSLLAITTTLFAQGYWIA